MKLRSIAVFLLFTVFSLNVCAINISDGDVFRVVSCSDNTKAMSINNIAEYNQKITMSAVDENSASQLWTFVSLSKDEPIFMLYNAESAIAVDMALSSGKKTVNSFVPFFM